VTSTAPPEADDWVAVTGEALPLAEMLAWATRPSCGAVVTFSGTVRDHAPGRDGVVSLEYEVFEKQAMTQLAAVVRAARSRWPEVERIAVLHRSGVLSVGEASVVVVVAAPHRAEAFDAARFCIDTVKTSVPIWKKETWAGGSDWSECSHEIVPPGRSVGVDAR